MYCPNLTPLANSSGLTEEKLSTGLSLRPFQLRLFKDCLASYPGQLTAYIGTKLKTINCSLSLTVKVGCSSDVPQFPARLQKGVRGDSGSLHFSHPSGRDVPRMSNPKMSNEVLIRSKKALTGLN